MLSTRKNLLEKYLSELVTPLHGVNPNVLTFLGSIPPLLFFVFVVMHWYVAALIAYVGLTLDVLDGTVARKYKKVTAFGGFLDSFMDRVGDFLLIAAFAYGGIVRWELAVPLLLFSYLTSYVRSRGELASNKQVSFALGLIERSERLIMLFVALLLYTIFPYVGLFGLNLAEAIFLIVTALSLFTVYERILFAYEKL